MVDDQQYKCAPDHPPMKNPLGKALWFCLRWYLKILGYVLLGSLALFFGIVRNMNRRQ